LEVSAAEYYRERNRKISRVLQAHFGKQNVSVTPGWELGRVTARIDSDLDTGELIDLVRKLIVHAGIPVRMAGRSVDGGADALGAVANSARIAAESPLAASTRPMEPYGGREKQGCMLAMIWPMRRERSPQLCSWSHPGFCSRSWRLCGDPKRVAVSHLSWRPR